MLVLAKITIHLICAHPAQNRSGYECSGRLKLTQPVPFTNTPSAAGYYTTGPIVLVEIASANWDETFAIEGVNF